MPIAQAEREALNELLDKPAFTPIGVQESATAQPSQSESGKEEEIVPTTGGEPVVPEPPKTVEQNVPYSRFEAIAKQRQEAERRAEEAEAMARELLASRQTQPEPSSDGVYKGQMDAKWVAMYGDNENSRKAYSYELERQREFREQVRRDALEAVREDRDTQNQVIIANEQSIDERLGILSAYLGRNLTDQEEEDVLTIVDEYTPKDRYGNYAGDLISMDKAWEIYNYRQSQQANRSRQGRQVPTAVTSSPTQGQPTSDRKEQDKNWKPDWNAWKKRLTN